MARPRRASKWVKVSRSSCWSGTANSAPLEGVAARRSATKSAMVTSGSWPTAEITGILER